MAQYLILIYGDETDYSTTSPRSGPRACRLHNRFSEQVVRAGRQDRRRRGAAADQRRPPRSAATSSPTARSLETKEALGGYYLIEANDLDQALAIAQALPGTGRRRRGPPDHGHLRE